MKQNRFIKHRHLLCLISNCKNKLRKAIIKNSSKEEIYAICECVLNICNGNLKITKTDYEKLSKFKQIFCRSCTKKRINTLNGKYLFSDD